MKQLVESIIKSIPDEDADSKKYMEYAELAKSINKEIYMDLMGIADDEKRHKKMLMDMLKYLLNQ